jgi:hypothetical protein
MLNIRWAYASSSEHDILPEVGAGQAFLRRIRWPPLLESICPRWGARFGHYPLAGSRGDVWELQKELAW